MVTKKLRLKTREEALFLLGAQDARIRQLERELKVGIYVNHDPNGEGVDISIRGSVSRIDKALNQLEEILRNRSASLLPEISPKNISAEHDIKLPGTAIYITEYGKPVVPRGERQKAYVDAIAKHDMVVAIGPAGTGKTFMAVAAALRALRQRQVSRIILTRPIVEAGEKLGFLPGDFHEKVHPYLKPLYDAFYAMLGPEKFRLWKEDNIIEIVPLAYMRGRTLEHSFIILDEAQNTMPQQMKMFLTRMGMYSRVVITGDITQIDLKDKHQSGLMLAREILKKITAIKFIYFTHADIVRHPLVKDIIHAYDEWEKS
ncbi:MAG: PhoH family protein [bacterium]